VVLTVVLWSVILLIALTVGLLHIRETRGSRHRF
jgi:hypothetical protein